ncbi:MAG: hypothetical protein QXM55_03265, partial [Ignisphaera sp.]
LVEEHVILLNSINIDKCKSALYKEVLDKDKKEILNGFFSENSNLTCLMYILSDYVRNTYLESLKSSVKLGEGVSHYVLFVNYTLDQKIYLADLLTFLDIIEFRKNENSVLIRNNTPEDVHVRIKIPHFLGSFISFYD